MQKVLTILLVMALATAHSAPAFQGRDPELESGVQQAQEGDFDAAIATLERAVRRMAAQKSSGKDLSRAYLYLSIAHLGLGQQPAARARFLEALSANPQLELSPSEFPPRILSFFNEVKKEAAQATTAAPQPPAKAPPVAANPPPKKKKSRTGLVLVIGGGVAAAAIGVAAGGGGGSGGTTVPAGPTNSSTQPVQTNPPGTQPAPSTVPGQNQPPSAVFRVSPNPPRGQAPLNVSFTMCDSQDPEGDRLQFSYDFGDGERDGDPGTPCQRSKVYQTGGTFNATLCVTDGQPGHERCQAFAVDVIGPTPPPTTVPPPTTTTTTTTTLPPGFTLTLTTTGNFPGTARSDPPGIVCSFPPPMICTAVFSAGTTVTLTAPPDPAGHNTFTGDCAGINTCTVVMNADKRSNCDFFRSSLQSGRADGRPQGAVRWTSRLNVPGGKGQVVLNGRELAFVDSGIASGSVDAEGGRVRIEAQLVAADGEPGSWRFELTGRAPGALRVVAGEAAEMTSGAVTFRLSGRPGERVVFEFVLN